VVISDVLDDAGQAAVASLAEDGRPIAYLHCDVTRIGYIEQMVAFAVERFGRLDCAVNNAGWESAISSIADYDHASFERTTAINLAGVFYSVQVEIRHMLARGGGGAMVNLSSLAGLVGFANLGPYVMTKHGANGLTKAAAVEYSKVGIRTNSVCPGCIQTAMIDGPAAGSGIGNTQEVLGPMHPIGRQGRPGEVAEMIAWQCSDRASNVTGAVLAVDGGYTCQ
jgi:NAD(P)-dependent dehydrogenase (short-subunit alcohol dehydrogenase family)